MDRPLICLVPSVSSRAKPDVPPHPSTVSLFQGNALAQFKIVTPKGTSFAVAGGGYDFETEALAPLGLDIVEIDASSENSFIDAAHDADVVYAKGRNFTKRMIDGLQHCKLIALGTVGSDYVDVAA